MIENGRPGDCNIWVQLSISVVARAELLHCSQRWNHNELVETLSLGLDTITFVTLLLRFLLHLPRVHTLSIPLFVSSWPPDRRVGHFYIKSLASLDQIRNRFETPLVYLAQFLTICLAVGTNFNAALPPGFAYSSLSCHLLHLQSYRHNHMHTKDDLSTQA